MDEDDEVLLLLDELVPLVELLVVRLSMHANMELMRSAEDLLCLLEETFEALFWDFEGVPDEELLDEETFDILMAFASVLCVGGGGGGGCGVCVGGGGGSGGKGGKGGNGG